jgi:hypothetical protein
MAMFNSILTQIELDNIDQRIKSIDKLLDLLNDDEELFWMLCAELDKLEKIIESSLIKTIKQEKIDGLTETNRWRRKSLQLIQGGLR